MKQLPDRFSRGAVRLTVPLAVIVSLLAALLGACGNEAGREAESPVADTTVREVAGTVSEASRGSAISVSGPKPRSVVTERGFHLAGSVRSDSGYVQYSLVLDSIVTIASGLIEIERSSDRSATFGRFSAGIDVESEWSGDGYVEVCLSDSLRQKCGDAVRIPVRIEVPHRTDGREILVYFPNRHIGKPKECEVVYPVTRRLPKGTTRVARAALYHLLLGPTPREAEQGYRLYIPVGIRLQSVRLDDGVATLDFNRSLTHISDRCDRDRFRAQIEQTLVQFESVRAISVTVAGQPWDAY